MLWLDPRDLRDCGEDVGEVGRRSLYTVSAQI